MNGAQCEVNDHLDGQRAASTYHMNKELQVGIRLGRLYYKME